MELRKVQEMGGGTVIVSLPKEWTRRNGVTKGSFISIDGMDTDRLVLYPVGKGEPRINEITLSYPAQYIQYLINEITGAYLIGYSLVKIQGKQKISYEDREAIRRAVYQLVGLEMVEEDAYSITLQFLLEPTTFDCGKVFRRMHLLVLGMHKDTLTSLVEMDRHLAKIVVERDDEVDRLYFLLVRLIRSAALDTKLAGTLKLTPIDCLDYRVAANMLEAAGDSAVQIAREVMTIDIRLNEGLKELFSTIASTLEEMQNTAVSAYLLRSRKDARQAVRLYRDLENKISKLDEQLSTQRPESLSHLSNIRAEMEKLGKIAVDIADLAVPLYPMVK